MALFSGPENFPLSRKGYGRVLLRFEVEYGTVVSVVEVGVEAAAIDAVLCGPDDTENHPVLCVVYSVPKDCIE